MPTRFHGEELELTVSIRSVCLGASSQRSPWPRVSFWLPSKRLSLRDLVECVAWKGPLVMGLGKWEPIGQICDVYVFSTV